MSQESLEWLNTNTLVGFTEKRGHAWHYREGADNHYPGPIPVGDVNKRLFHWSPVESPVYVNRDVQIDGVGLVPVPGQKAILRSDTSHVLGIFTDGYQPHPYDEWLVGAVSNILGDTLAIGSAGLLKGGGVAWVQVEVPDTLETPEGITFRPNLLAATSLDGSVATTYKRTITNVVCDNTLSAGLAERNNGEVYKLRHTRNSTLRLNEAREALRVVEKTADEFVDEVKLLTGTAVTDKQWTAFLDSLAPLPEDTDTRGAKRAASLAEGKREALTQLWNNDMRVAPWRNTAWGVLAATNTWQHHLSTMKSVNHRAERNMEAAVKGTIDKHDANTLALLGAVLAG